MKTLPLILCILILARRPGQERSNEIALHTRFCTMRWGYQATRDRRARSEANSINGMCVDRWLCRGGYCGGREHSQQILPSSLNHVKNFCFTLGRHRKHYIFPMYDLSYSMANHEETVAQFLFIRVTNHDVLSGETNFAGYSKLPQKVKISQFTIHNSSYQGTLLLLIHFR